MGAIFLNDCKYLQYFKVLTIKNRIFVNVLQTLVKDIANRLATFVPLNNIVCVVLFNNNNNKTTCYTSASNCSNVYLCSLWVNYTKSLCSILLFRLTTNLGLCTFYERYVVLIVLPRLGIKPLKQACHETEADHCYY